jgi:outer membrane lipoprotein SlyB
MNKSIVKAVTAALLVSLTAGCANTGANYRPVVDTKGVDLNRYEADLVECQQYANQTAGAGESAAAGAAAGAVFGALLAAAAGGGTSRKSTAGVGAVTGAAGAAGQGENNQRNVIRRCLSGRGYKVLQ